MEATLTQEIVTISPFEKTKDDLIKFVADYENLVVTDETLEEAKKARITLRDVRYNIQAKEKENIDKLNEFKNKVWGGAKELIAILTPTEEKIDSGIKAIENRKAAIRVEKERIEREKVEAEIKAEQERLATVERERIAAIEAAQKAEAERLAKLQAEMDERNRIEQERLNKIKAEQEAKERAIIADQQRIQKEQEAREAKIKAEQEAIERQKREIEEARQREINEKKRLAELEQARIESAEKARIEAEAKAKREAEERIEADRKIKEELARQESLKPDKQKLSDFANNLDLIIYPTLNDKKAQSILENVQIKIAEIKLFIDSEIEKL